MRRISASIVAAIAASGLGLSALPAQALTINATFDASITDDQNAAAIQAAINSAIGQYAKLDPSLSVNIEFAYAPVGVLGFSEVAGYTIEYNQYIQALAARAAATPGNSVLASAVANLAYGNKYVENPARDYLDITAADARNLGVANAPGVQQQLFYPGLDGVIFLGSQAPNFSFSDTVGPEQLSARNVIMHEINEVLGIGGGSNPPEGLRPLDLYRYNGFHSPSYTADLNEVAYFSIDGGATAIDYFNQSSEGDYDDWALNVPVDVPCYVPQTIQSFKTCDGQANLTLGPDTPEGLALQSVGYSFAGGIPEPGEWALMLTGLAAVGVAMRRGRDVAAVA